MGPTRMDATPPRPAAFLTVVGSAFALEGALYSAVTPILPLLSRTLHMSESQAGVMLASYSAGLVAGSLLCVLALRRVNARAGAFGALVLLSAATMVFAWSQNYEVALGARLVQGVAGGATWTACVSWLLRLWPMEKRGEALGLAMGPALVGTIAGPAIGTVAVDLGIVGAYSMVSLLCLGAAAWLLRMPPSSQRGSEHEAPSTVRRRRRTLAVLGAVLVTLTGALLGLLNLTAPLVLVDLGAAERTPGLVFVAAAVMTVLAARPFGVLVDRRGALRTTCSALVPTAALLPAFGAGPGLPVTGLVVVILLLANNLCYLSSGTLLSREGEGAGRSLYFVTAMSATVWGLGETAGALMAGVGLDHVGAVWTTVVGALLALAMLAGVAVTLIASSRTPGHVSAEPEAALERDCSS